MYAESAGPTGPGRFFFYEKGRLDIKGNSVRRQDISGLNIRMQDRVICMMAVLLSALVLTTACATGEKGQQEKDYGVFLSIDDSEMQKLEGYRTVVIDAQYFSAGDIERLHENRIEVYTYLNIGSIENFRDYYAEYQELALGEYENWEEEQWIDVSNEEWRQFVQELTETLSEKGVDGFFIDNCDVYFHYPDEEIFEGLTAILKDIMALDKAVVINGGDAYITAYRQRYGSAADIMTAVNQEEVLSSYDFDSDTFGRNTAEERDYFSEYVEACKADGMEVFLLEYTTDSRLTEEIEAYCRDKGFRYYIADSIELD